MSKIAAIQMCSSDDLDANLKAAKGLMQLAANQGAKLVVLPENFAIMNAKDGQNSFNAREKFGAGKIQDFLANEAARQQLWIVGGTIPIESEEGNKARAASIIYNDKGDVVGRYDKIHLFDVALSEKEFYKESALTQAGNHITVIETPFGKLGVLVCYDIRFPELARCLFNQGADIIAIPAAFTVRTGKAHWELLCRSRAVENFCYVVGAAQGGNHSGGRQTYGHSLIVDPWGNIAASKPDIIPGVIAADINLKQLNDIRHSIPVQTHQRIFFDLTKL